MSFEASLVISSSPYSPAAISISVNTPTGPSFSMHAEFLRCIRNSYCIRLNLWSLSSTIIHIQLPDIFKSAGCYLVLMHDNLAIFVFYACRCSISFVCSNSHSDLCMHWTPFKLILIGLVIHKRKYKSEVPSSLFLRLLLKWSIF